jgi:hypothetical protein
MTSAVVHACDVRIYSEPSCRIFYTSNEKPTPDLSAGSARNRKPRYSGGPLVSLLFCLIGKAGFVTEAL